MQNNYLFSLFVYFKLLLTKYILIVPYIAMKTFCKLKLNCLKKQRIFFVVYKNLKKVN